MTRIKFCGLSTPDSVDAAIGAGAAYLGFVFFPPSPRHLTLDRAAGLIARVPPATARVAVLVDADDETIDAVLAAGIDTLQLHGRETPDRIAAVRARTGRPVWRAAGVATRADITAAIAAAGPADRLLLDAKAPREATLPGGNGQAFDWRLLDGMHLPPGWGLSGGLDAGNVGDALALLRPAFVDVSSGIEDQPGVKSVSKIRAFAAAVHGR
ncbi:phosphoribosylanthranilate isomerase [Polymorphobacter fuscus]|uniref:N-(5'-phosphoribosyl)anthranilate isomerase n=1 Tax=Sandarakinorhabdus fusca TaxID=1439888 RepID=A0A7C9GPY6_9SPHN|nr:phosphoribosylanthranilate isomerase [Polymorphobacter fuscus]KAB7645453.1 phosphoribosylanthranilate isomerase [Polymorphobacter fuscus]MQT17877.1 phosphoribosylanthranilate isomerase [Polymorphobacter fuscus]NJC08506.1 phosphoribosylanthranilate isomerase [Polymorphobacter fuscus]